MAPDLTSSMAGRTDRDATSAVIRLAAIMSDQSVGLESAKSVTLKVPATLTSTSTRPIASLISATKAKKSSKSVASAARPHAGEAPSWSSVIMASSGSAATSVTASRAPWDASSRHTSRPIVPPAPVTSTTLSFSRNVAPLSRIRPCHV